MANVEEVSVSLTPQMAAMMRRLVDSGEYASASELVREALREWALRRDQQDTAIEELRRKWDAGVDSGPATDGGDAFARIRARIEAPSTDRSVS